MAKQRRWWWSKKRFEREVWLEMMEMQKENLEILSESPLARLLMVSRDDAFDWRYTVFDYDPNDSRLMAGQVEGILVPWLINSGYHSANEAFGAGIYNIRLSGWTGDIVLRTQSEEIYSE